MKGVLLINLGTPDSPKPADVRRYLNQFLMDGRVIDVSPLKRFLLVRGLIVPFRYRASAKCYKEIWTREGSPLLVHGRNVKEKLQKALDCPVALGMRYQNPSIESALEELKGCTSIKVIPLFPQYASASTGSAHEEVMRIVSQWQVIPSIDFVNSYPTQEKMIAAFADRGAKAKEHDAVVFSFHGLPERQLKKADDRGVCLTENCCAKNKNPACYGAQCAQTAKAIAEKLGIEEYEMSFQSRLGKDPWIKPFTLDVLEKLAKNGKKRVAVFCPAFVADCLETLYEISVEYQEEFIKFGGDKVTLIESLNDHPLWIEALQELAEGSTT